MKSYPSSIRGFLQWLKNNDLASVHNHVDIQPWRTIFALDFGCIFLGGDSPTNNVNVGEGGAPQKCNNLNAKISEQNNKAPWSLQFEIY